ncbi:MAG: hypothetical protein AAFV59_09365 [Pseudomonadota bacterium]
MDKSWPAEFGENGAVINHPSMTPERRKTYAGFYAADESHPDLDTPWWIAVPSIAFWVFGPNLLNWFEDLWTGWLYWVACAVFVLSGAAVQYAIFKAYRCFSKRTD